jgi:hypothetical protein
MDPSSEGIIRWSAQRAHQHLQAVVPAAIAIPLASLIAGQFIALPDKPTITGRIVQGIESIIAGVAAVALLAFIYAVLVAPYEQRSALRRQLAAVEDKVKELCESAHETQEIVPEDRRLFGAFKQALPKDSHVLHWLREWAHARIYRSSDIEPLSKYFDAWRNSDYHFANIKLELAHREFMEAASDFLAYQAGHSQWVPQEIQTDLDDPTHSVYPEDDYNQSHAIRDGLRKRADKVLSAHNELYMIGSRLGL